MSQRDLSNRVIVITGASSGIGAATARACAAAGMDVVLAARRLDRLEQLADDLRRTGRRALAVACDVNRDQDVAELVRRTRADMGRLDVMFANAGYGLFASVMGTGDAAMRDIFETNFYGTLRCVWHAVPVMRKQGGGHLLINSSVVSEVGPPMYGAYAATKAAQDAIGCALRAELAHENIHVTTIHPIGTSTDFFATVRDHSANKAAEPNTHHLLRQPVEYVARRIVGAIRRPRAEVWPSRMTQLGIAIGTMFPALTARALRRMALRYGHDVLSEDHPE